MSREHGGWRVQANVVRGGEAPRDQVPDGGILDRDGGKGAPGRGTEHTKAWRWELLLPPWRTWSREGREPWRGGLQREVRSRSWKTSGDLGLGPVTWGPLEDLKAGRSISIHCPQLPGVPVTISDNSREATSIQQKLCLGFSVGITPGLVIYSPALMVLASRRGYSSVNATVMRTNTHTLQHAMLLS